MLKKVIAGMLIIVLLATVMIFPAYGESIPGFEEMFVSQYDPSDPEIMDLASLETYYTNDLSASINAEIYGQYIPSGSPDHYSMPKTFDREKIFKAHKFKNPNYVKALMDQNELYRNIVDEVWYAVPVYYVEGPCGIVYYRRGQDEQWEYCGYSRSVSNPKAERYFDPYSVEQKLQSMGISSVIDAKFLLFGSKMLFIYAKDSDLCEYMLTLDVGRLGIFENEAYLREFSTYFNSRGEMIPIMTDAPNGGHQYAKPDYTAEAEELYALGLFQGTGAGFDLISSPTRIQGATMLIRSLGQEEEALSSSYRNVFNDIPDDNWGMKYANYAFEKGITKGTGEGEFSPEVDITQRQFITLLLRAMGYEEKDMNWWFASDLGLFGDDNGTLFPRTEDISFFTRGDMIKIIHNALDCYTADGQLLRDVIGI